MKTVTPYSKQELSDQYPDPEWRSRLLEIVGLTDFLAECTITGDYRISDEINSSIVVSESGQRLLTALAKQQVPVKEARLMCLLHLAYIDLLIDPEKMDPDALAQAVGDQIRAGDLRLPFVFGPDLYNRAAEMFPERRRTLGMSETVRLLDGMPPGVFQSGPWVSGPYGLLRSQTNRSVPPTRRVRLQHCHDVACQTVHVTVLDTDGTAPINEHRHKAFRLLDAEAEVPSEWSAFLGDIASSEANEFDDLDAGSLPLLLGEALSDGELRLLLEHLLDHTKGILRTQLESLGMRGRADEITRTLTRAQLLQLLLLNPDSALCSSLDQLVFTGAISVPPGEVRRPVLQRSRTMGAFSLRPELSSDGLRFKASRELAPLRLRRLIERMFRLDEIDNAQELDWQLRSVSGPTLEARLDEYLRTASPDEVLRRLVLARRNNVGVAQDELRLVQDEGVSDQKILDRIMWKLGFDVERYQPLHQEFWRLHERLKQSAISAVVSTTVDEEALRGVGANYFVAMERLLSDTLSYATWALTTDHPTSDRPFVYRPSPDSRIAFRRLTEFDTQRTESPREPIVFDERVTLFGLCSGFECLASLLDSLSSDRADDSPTSSGLPAYVGKTDLQRFPFTRGVAFLDLTDASRASLVASLRHVSKTLLQGEVPEVRNEQLHFRRSNADVDRLLTCLDSAEEAVHALENAGLTRILFFPDRHESDRWGRSTVFFTDRRGREIAFGRPSPYEWVGLPPLHQPQYLLTSALFAEPNEVLRFSPGFDSEFAEMWVNFPKRRTAGTRGRDAVESPLPVTLREGENVL